MTFKNKNLEVFTDYKLGKYIFGQIDKYTDYIYEQIDFILPDKIMHLNFKLDNKINLNKKLFKLNIHDDTVYMFKSLTYLNVGFIDTVIDMLNIKKDHCFINVIDLTYTVYLNVKEFIQKNLDITFILYFTTEYKDNVNMNMYEFTDMLLENKNMIIFVDSKISTNIAVMISPRRYITTLKEPLITDPKAHYLIQLLDNSLVDNKDKLILSLDLVDFCNGSI